jgi:hypothetical protein
MPTATRSSSPSTGSVPRPSADGLAELQVRWPSIPIVFCETRKLAEEWTYRYLAAAQTWAETEAAALQRIGLATETPIELATDDTTPAPSAERDPRLGPR